VSYWIIEHLLGINSLEWQCSSSIDGLWLCSSCHYGHCCWQFFWQV